MKKQNGLALLVAMIVLVVMSLAGIGLIRTVDTGGLVAGNLAFRKSATHSADAGVEAARAWLLANPNSLIDNLASAGYYATAQPGLDLTGNQTPTNAADDLKWNQSASTKPFCLATDTAGNTVCYIIHRLCDTVGALDGGTCSTKMGARGGSSLGAIRQMTTYQQGAWPSVTQYGYYRVTVRVAGPRNNVSFVQAFVVI